MLVPKNTSYTTLSPGLGSPPNHESVEIMGTFDAPCTGSGLLGTYGGSFMYSKTTALPSFGLKFCLVTICHL